MLPWDSAPTWFYFANRDCQAKGHKDQVCGVSFDPQGKTLASCSLDKTAQLWDVVAGGSTQLIAPLSCAGDASTP